MIPAAHPEQADGAFTTAEVEVYYDNIVIIRDGEVVLDIFHDEGDVPLNKATLKSYAEGTVLVVDVSDIG